MPVSCPTCGKQVSSTAQFCRSCGGAIQASAPPQTPSPRVAQPQSSVIESRPAVPAGGALSDWDIERLRHPSEKMAFGMMAGMTVLAAILVAVLTLGLALLYLLLVIPGYLLSEWIGGRITRALLLGNHPRVSPNNYPEIHNAVVDLAHRMGIRDQFETYVVQETAMNASFRSIFGTSHMVLFSHLVEGVRDHPDQLRTIIAHELGHLRAGHFRWHWVVSPWRIIPWIHNWYSRSCEYTCDRIALALCGNTEESMRAIAKLAAGQRLGQHANLDALVQQAYEVDSSLAAWFAEISSTHPMTVKRIRAMREMAARGW